MGQCSEMIDSKSEPYPCTNWAIDKVKGRGYCGQHIASVVRADDERRRSEKARYELDKRIDLYLAWREEHPSIHDRMPIS